MDPKDLKRYEAATNDLDKLVSCLTTLKTRVDDVLGLGEGKKKSPTYLKGSLEASTTVSPADKQIVERHIAALKTVQPDVKVAFDDFKKLFFRNVDKDFATLDDLRKKYESTFKHAERIYDLDRSFFPSLTNELKRIYESRGELANASMVSIHQHLVIFMKEYPRVAQVIGLAGGKR